LLNSIKPLFSEAFTRYHANFITSDTLGVLHKRAQWPSHKQLTWKFLSEHRNKIFRYTETFRLPCYGIGTSDKCIGVTILQSNISDTKLNFLSDVKFLYISVQFLVCTYATQTNRAEFAEPP